MTSALPNPFMTYQPSRQAMIDAVCLRAVEDALDPHEAAIRYHGEWADCRRIRVGGAS